MIDRVDPAERPSATRFHMLRRREGHRTFHALPTVGARDEGQVSGKGASEWLFFKGGMSIVLILGLITLPAVAAVIGVRMDGAGASGRTDQAHAGAVALACPSGHRMLAARNH
jgi:hypothetical protein